MAPLLELTDDLLGEILLRLAPDDPACLLRASLACKRWRRILADPAFRRRHQELHPTPLVLGFIQVVSDRVPYASRFVSLDPAARRPAARDLPGWLALDCRHGRALFATPSPGPDTELALDLVVWDPLTNEQRCLPRPSPPLTDLIFHFNAAVLCAAAAEGCDHHDCHGGPFRVVFLVTTLHGIHVTSARAYSSETDDWSELSIEHPYACIRHKPFPSALVGDTLYLCDNWANVFEFQLGAQRLSLIDRPPKSNCIGIVISLTSEENGGLGSLGIASMEEEPCLRLCLWSRETAHDGVARWAWSRAIDLEKLLPDGILPPPRLASDRPQLPIAFVVGFAECTDAFFVQVRAHGDVYMVQPSSGMARKVCEGYRNYLFPYTSFCIPVTGVASTGEGPREGAPSA